MAFSTESKSEQKITNEELDSILKLLQHPDIKKMIKDIEKSSSK